MNLSRYFGRARGALRRKQKLAAERAIVAAEFDAAFYLSGNPDIASAGADPLDHFLLHGWREGRDPSAKFSVSAYLETYPDIAQAGVNPLVHYVQAGRAEGRKPRNPLGFRHQVIATSLPIEARIAAAAERTAKIRLGAADDLLAALSRSRTGLKALHITFSHDDYTANLGGVQLCLQREGARLAQLGRDHLHIYPATHWPVVRTTEACPLGVLLNGERLGVFTASDIAELLRHAGEGAVRSLALHSLLGHSVDEVGAIARSAGLSGGFFWLHDFASLCAGYHLMRNDVQDCGAPPPNSPACGVCLYGPERRRHLAEHERLFEMLELTVVSPSRSALEFWRSSWRFRAAGEVVHPHALLQPRGAAPAQVEGRLKVAFAGMPAPHKGWPVFRELVARFVDDDRYEFHHLGARQAGGVDATFHAVSVTDDQPRAMQAALEAIGADVVLIWSLCRETFSFSAYEAAAAGAAVITNPDSGNVAAFVEEHGLGRLLADEAALAAAFESGEILSLSRGRRAAQVYDLEFSALTVDLLMETA
ncbi:glycosyltransferase [Phenylobacterium deserti]|uniref:Glycosyl transferase family 1 domain-containing protein n=1 Tax=Phenylobacterium deserti TaxID=1914756 RepID=A0A328ASC8_9CAUL|nr:glycosyltransferase [Phenylobacterium deserti]RAK57870.1 hypothetical protein DJ018_08155 [Phenylobacterium deserti]